MTRRLVVLTAGLSQPSSTRLLADRLADAVTAQVGARGEAVTVDVIEVRELAHDLATTMSTGGMPTPAVQRARDRVAAADGLIAVTPVFAASYAGLFKMFVDVLEPEALTGLPVLIGATAGTARHQLVLDHAMRPLFSYLRAVVVPTGVFAATDDFGGPGSAALGERIARAAAELAAAITAPDLSGAVDSAGVVGAGAGTTPRRRASGTGVDAPVDDFASLLAQVGQ